MIKRYLRNFITNPIIRMSYLSILGFYNKMPDEKYLRKMFKLVFGKEPDLDNPQTFNEKLQWLKLYDRNPLYTTLVDKYAVRDYIKEKLGEKYLIPLVGGPWTNARDIDFDKLPDQFVLKCTHDSGSIVICLDKETFDVKTARKKLNRALKRNYYYLNREWPYKNVKPQIIAEKYMEDDKLKELRDYKFFAFDGVVKVLFIATDRQNANEETKFDFYDMNFCHIDMRNGHPNSKVIIERPETFEEMKSLAEKLSVGIPLLRVDFYEVNGNVYFGELTLSHWGGMTPYEPEEWDEIFGSWIKLPEISGRKIIS